MFPGYGTISGCEISHHLVDLVTESIFEKAAVLCFQNYLIQLLWQNRLPRWAAADKRLVLAQKPS